MPHQLRRIITVNIRNPQTGLPSGRIAELDPRGGVLAVGDNGVGKTTFLRLLPLFYGATPTQVLKGTGRASMIGYTLPDASCAVAYEYERESATDLRTVVMHAKAGEEAPQFHIIHGGYREVYFYDEHNQYVGRDEFKARVEAMGVEVTRKLSLHQYRSVILNERLQTKEGVELRRLAALHSLGPRALYNLDQIAAAMANEKINFRDLQNIVLERVSDAHMVGVKPTNVRELKQNRESVSRWIEDRSHLADILKRKPDAQRINERVTRIKGLHLELCSLHVSVKSALAQAGTERGQLIEQRHELSARFTDQADAIQDTISGLEQTSKAANASAHAKATQVESALARQAHFQRIGALDLSALEDTESALQAQKVAKEGEHAALTAAVGDVTMHRDERKRAIERAASDQIASIDARNQNALRAAIVNIKALSQAREEALSALPTPARLAEIAAERIKIGAAEGENGQKIQNPVASAQSRAERDAAEEEANRWEDELSKAQSHTGTTGDALRVARAATDQALASVDQLEQQARIVSDQIEGLQASLTPEPGSMLEFVRAGEPALWASTAKVLEPSLLGRTDLHPTLLDDALDGGPNDGTVIVGPARILVQSLDSPRWFDMQEMREDLTKKQGIAGQVADALRLATERAKQLGGQVKLAEAAHGAATAHESLAKAALKSAREKRGRFVKVVQEEERTAKAAAIAAQALLRERNSALDAEETRVTQGARVARESVLRDFSDQRLRLDQDDADATLRFDEEKQTVQSRKFDELARLHDDYERKLAGMGLDPRRVSDLEHAIEKLGVTLEAIARNRHEVSAWRVFCREQLPSLGSDQLEYERLVQRALEVGQKLQGERDRLDDLAASAKKALGDIDNAIANRAREVERLEELRVNGLKDYLDHVPSHLQVDWSVPELEQTLKARRTTLESESDEIQKETRTLRNEMLKRPGGLADWLDIKERDLPDRQRLLPHQYLCAQAQVLCDWFEPMESGPYIDQLAKEMHGFFNLAGEFARGLDLFERRVQSFNSELGKALSQTKRFERFRDLSVTVSSSVGQLGYIKVLRQMQDKGASNPMAYRSVMRSIQDLPTDEDAALVRAFRDALQSDGGVKINLNEQVRLECSLYENGQRRTISSEEEFRSISSNGNSALITAMFLMGFVQMIRGDAPVRLTWLCDEIGRFDPNNLGAFLQTLDQHKIDVISACPSIDPALARFFPRLCVFESNGAVYTTEQQLEGAVHGED